jgi:hypothetical protein
MSGSNRAEARSGNDRDRDHGIQEDQDLGKARGHLQALSKRLEESDDNASFEGQYWFYEYLRQLNFEVNHLVEEFEGHLQPPISFDDVVEQLIQPLEIIYDDLRKYYWAPGSLLERLAISGVDKALLTAIDEIRRDWGLLASATREYVTARQNLVPEEPVSLIVVNRQTPEQPITLLATSEAFYLKLLAFMKLLSGLVTNEVFIVEHSRLANLPKPANRRNR